MPFEKGHKGYGGRKAGSKSRRKYNERPKNTKQTIDRYFGIKEWEKSTSKKILDQDKVDYYINNDLPLDELYDEMKLYDYSWKSGNKRYNLNSQMKAKKDKENGGDENV